MRTYPYLIHKKNSSALHEALLRRSTLSIGSDRTIADVATRWIENVALRVRLSTVTGYRERLNNHILPALGKIPLSDLTRGEVARFTSALLERGLTKVSTYNIVSILRAIYFDAMEDGQVFYNPAANIAQVLRLKNAPKRMRPFNLLEARRFLRFAKRYEPHYYPVFLCALMTGMRKGELFAMRPRDVHFAEGFIEVCSSLSGNELTAPKNYKVRRVDMNRRLATVLFKYLRWKQARALELEHEKPENERRTKDELLSEIMAKPLFTGLRSPKLGRNYVLKVLHRTIKRAGLHQIRLHDLRHTYVTLLIEQGENLAYIRDQLGHSSIQITADVYGHLVAGSNRSAVERLAKSLENTKVHLKKNRHYTNVNRNYMRWVVAPYMLKKSDRFRNWT